MKQTDMFGDDTTALPKVYPDKSPWRAPAGYADVPGTGPEGETCGGCRFHWVKKHKGRRYHKCSISPRRVEYGPTGDIQVGTAACRQFSPRHPAAK